MADDIYALAEKQHKKRVILISLLTALILIPVLAWGVLWLVLNSYEQSHALLPGFYCGMTRSDFEAAFAEQFPGIALSREGHLSDKSPCVCAYCPELTLGSITRPAILQFGFRKSNGRLFSVSVHFICGSEKLTEADMTGDYISQETVNRNLGMMDDEISASIQFLTEKYGEAADPGGMYYKAALCGLTEASSYWYTILSVQELVSDREPPIEIPGFTDPADEIMRIVMLHSTGAHGAHITDFPEIWRGM